MSGQENWQILLDYISNQMLEIQKSSDAKIQDSGFNSDVRVEKWLDFGSPTSLKELTLGLSFDKGRTYTVKDNPNDEVGRQVPDTADFYLTIASSLIFPQMKQIDYECSDRGLVEKVIFSHDSLMTDEQKLPKVNLKINGSYGSSGNPFSWSDLFDGKNQDSSLTFSHKNGILVIEREGSQISGLENLCAEVDNFFSNSVPTPEEIIERFDAFKVKYGK